MFQELRARYRPDKVRVLFVGESPPPSGKTFFYAGNSNLFRHWKAAFGEVFEKDWQSAEQFLRWYRAQGCYLEDLLDWPVPFNRSQRRSLWPAGVGALARKIDEFRPRAVVAVMKTIAPTVEQAVAESRVNTQYRICGFPFPGRYLRQSEREARHILTELKQVEIIA